MLRIHLVRVIGVIATVAILLSFKEHFTGTYCVGDPVDNWCENVSCNQALIGYTPGGAHIYCYRQVNSYDECGLIPRCTNLGALQPEP